jgi:hypothetical protein
MTRLYSLVESASHPNFSPLYRRLKLEEQRFASMRKLLSAVKKQPPDFIVAEFFYGYSNDYAGITISNLDVLLYSLQRYAPECRCIVLVAKEEREHVDQLQEIFPLHDILVQPAGEAQIKAALAKG